MKKNYQRKPAPAAPRGIALPDTVTVAMAELAESMREGLLALAVGEGLQVMGGDDGRGRRRPYAGPRASMTPSAPRSVTGAKTAR